MTDELKPCPFCGSRGIDLDEYWHRNYCTNCGTRGPAAGNRPRAAWNTRADLATPMRCAECDCEKGGADCNWIATPTPAVDDADLTAVYLAGRHDERKATPLDDPRVKALVEAATELHDKAVKKHQRGRSDIWPIIRKTRAALLALEENK